MAAPQNRSQVPAGSVLGEKFRITAEIGRGGMAAVYEAENIHIGKRVAVKILNPELTTSRIVRERFLREARAAAAIRSPYICDVYDSGMFEGRPFLVMELLEGESLYDMMTRVRRLDTTLTLRIAIHSCRGLGKAHEANVIHRDLKPENIFLTKSEEGELVAKILDFGLAKFYESTEPDAANIRLTREGALFGTPAYMSPEQAKGRGDVDHRADLWALGCIVYECLTAQTVWNVDQGVAMILAQIAGAPIPKPSKLRPDLPPAFDEWFLKALDRDPNKRFQNAREFADALEAALLPTADTAAPQRGSAPSDQEGALVDELVSQSHAMIPGSPAQEGLDLRPEEIMTLRPAASKSRWKPFAALAGVAGVALGGYGYYFYVLNPQPGPSAPSPSASIAAPDAGGVDAAVLEKLEPMEKEPYALQIGKAQELLSSGKVEQSLSMFKEAFNNGGSGVARGLYNHATVALPASDGPCRVTGLSRPRPFDVTVMSSRPTVALSKLGPIAVWVDNQQEAAKRQAFAAVLDAPLRRISPLRAVTPEADSVRHPQLLASGDKLALIYWDGAGQEPGVYVRMLEADGRIASRAHRLSGVQRHEFYPALARAKDGTYWAAWEETLDKGADVMARHLSADGQPLGPAVRLTALAQVRGSTTEASKPDISLDGTHMNIVFSLERTKKKQIMLLRVALDDPSLRSGVSLKDDPKDKRRRKKSDDRVVGKMEPVSASHGKNAQPRIACAKHGCFVVWDDESAGALAAFVDPEKGDVLWHREFARKGSRPGVATSDNGAAVAWYEGSRVKLARITRDGLDKPTTLARVGGYQPYPAIAAGEKSGDWYVAWRDYEAGHLEAFVVRARCE
ncbi:MAG: serine/threonine-protein kinase [Polyangiaceae bacterium]